ncbi:MAG: T9SS type A sorting domain-containing protein [Bacteroidota bacterium]
MFPNPCHTVVTITTNLEAVIIRLVNSPGQTVQELAATGRDETGIDLREIPAGLYLVQVQSESGTEVKKPVKY